MKRLFQRLGRLLLEPSLRWFLLIVLGNTVLSLAIQLSLYSWAGLGYWASSALAFVIASVSSFYFNRKYSFHSKGNVGRDAARFALNIAVCYLLAYGAAQPLAQWAIPRLGWEWLVRWQGQITLICGNGLFTCLNYFGQRCFAFRER